MKPNLIIGSTSQLSNYFDNENFIKIPSRDIDYDKVLSIKYNKVFLLFAEQRTFIDNDDDCFYRINVEYTLEVINKIYNHCDEIIVYSTAELWNRYNGPISIDLPYDYNETPYIKSKHILCDTIKSTPNLRKKIKIIYPFNFNSSHRKEGFLFFKIFNSILNNEKYKIGNIDFNRDITHPKIIVNESINANSDKIIGMGLLINVKKFVCDIFDNLQLNVYDYLDFTTTNFLSNTRNEYYNEIKYSSYDELLKLTIEDIKNKKNDKTC
jgi:nucleoside-diphosphate-sugar epimerase